MPLLTDIHGRREFCKRLASAAACTGGLALLPGCSGGNPGSSIPGSPLSNISASIVSGKVSLSVAGSPLASSGGMALVNSPAGSFLVARTSATAFVAVTANCTHQACIVSLGTGSSYVCPCHGSEYDTSGRVIVGPAALPLQQYRTQFTDPVLTIG